MLTLEWTSSLEVFVRGARSRTGSTMLRPRDPVVDQLAWTSFTDQQRLTQMWDRDRYRPGVADSPER